MKKKQGFIFLTAGTVLCAIINFVYSVLSKRYVLPEELGIFSTCMIVESYLSYLQLGSINAYNRDLPQLLGAGKTEEAKNLKNSVFTFLLVVYGATLVLGTLFFSVLYPIIFGEELTFRYTFGYIVTVVATVFSIFHNFGMSTARINGKFNFSALAELVGSVVSVAVGIVAIILLRRTGYEYYGLYVRCILMYAVPLLLYIGSFKGVRLKFDFKLIKPVLLSGIPLLINSFIWTIVTSIDKFVILAFLDTTALGNYSVALLGFSTLVIIPKTISNVYYIKMNELYGATGSVEKLIEYAKHSTLINSIITCVTSICAFYILPIFIRIVMPGYTEGTAAAQIIIIGVAIYSSTFSFGHLFTVLKKNAQLIMNSVLLCVFNAVFSSALVLAFGADINNVAIGTALSYALYSILLITRLRRLCGSDLKSMLRNSWLAVLCAIVPCLGFYFLSVWLSFSVYIAFAASFIVMLALLAFFYHNDIKELITKKRGLL